MDELAIGSYRDRSSSFPTIPLDILFDIFQHLPIQSVLALRQFLCYHPSAQSLGSPSADSCPGTKHPYTLLRLQRVIQCWDLAVLQPVCIAKPTYMEGPYDRVVINDDPSSSAMIAIQSSLTEIDFEGKNPESAFVSLSTIDGLRETHLLSGSTLVTRHPEHDGEVSIWDISDQPCEKIQFVSPSLSPFHYCEAMHLCDDYIVIIRCQIVELYSTIPRPNNIATPGVSISYPLAQHSFQRPLQSVYVSGQVNWHAARSRRSSPINIAVRYRSTNGWLAITLHLFVLTPNPAYIPGRETSLYNLPYAAQPTLVQTIGLPVFSPQMSDVALGRYGTVIWLDNYYEDWAYAREPSEFDQRLAGQILTATGGFSTSQHGSHDSMVFHVRDRNDWSVVAIDEESGRIVVGDVDGAMTLFEYL
ncbi:uncharacterized protein F5891DRAFT_1185051 [Suillus fuscotomentosus]|uniref:F-box domain-containing protein n=1 Tax=Suillus fuscotomentosus TaxID=1912939 RepID=A0AAD4ED73_9AGAM|nr:uncharacterized protein F5891DRAFT_1185051 [Suillus fuscotomentosus]KAG1904089.1 hypothetical protein F5891DRAFT_1185051 [Suillus fuscotomentosus]